MSRTKVNFVKGDARTIEYRVWGAWLRKAALLLDRQMLMWGGEDDPFSYNETASVAFLAAAGSLAGHVALAECCTQKLSSAADSAKERKRKRQGRADLWLHADQKGWAFEFKQRMSVGVSRGTGRLMSLTEAARKCASDVIEESHGTPVAGMIVSLYWVEKDAAAQRAAEEIERFAHDNVDYCWSLNPPGNLRPTYLLFDLI